MRVGVPKEIATSERRVALVPDGVKTLREAEFDVVIEAGAGVEASPWGLQFELVSFPDGKAYEKEYLTRLWHPAFPAE